MSIVENLKSASIKNIIYKLKTSLHFWKIKKLNFYKDTTKASFFALLNVNVIVILHLNRITSKSNFSSFLLRDAQITARPTFCVERKEMTLSVYPCHCHFYLVSGTFSFDLNKKIFFLFCFHILPISYSVAPAE